jgi:uracil-DNA glycosylase
MSEEVLTISVYSQHRTWYDVFNDNKVNLKILPIRSSWKKVISPLLLNPKFQKNINEKLSNELKNGKEIYPYPDSVFRAFNTTKYKDVCVVILGQDPYFDYELFDSLKTPQAMGLSFSVPKGTKIPSSLSNIFNNLLKYKHIKSIPTHGNLESWASQGCLLLNTSLTVIHGSNNKNCHQSNWCWFTNEIIKYLSEHCEHIIFVLWGSNALEKMPLIDVDKHEVIVSSHPSGLSCHKPIKQYPAFYECDHFGKVNNKLIEWNKEPIDWNI